MAINDNLKCPYCGDDESVYEFLKYVIQHREMYENGKKEDITCVNCGGTFNMYIIEIIYGTDTILSKITEYEDERERLLRSGKSGL